MTDKLERLEKAKELDLEPWFNAVELVEEFNVKISDPMDTITQAKVVGESDAYTVGVDMDSRQAKCQCEDEFYRKGTCKHELAVHLALMVLSTDSDSKVFEALFENPELFVRQERM
jgi:uncharacterized Zn finger protein